MLPKPPHREEIKAAIRMHGETLISLSRKSGLARDSVAVCLKRPLPSANRAVANLLGIPLHQLWPQWYDASGKRIPLRSTYKHSAKRPQRHSKKSPRHLTKNGSAA